MRKNVDFIKILFITIVIFCLMNVKVESQTYQDSCIRIVWEHNPDKGYFNPDSVLIDSCQCPDMLWDYCPYLYANRWYKLYLPNGAINLPAYPHDTTIFVTWQDIDTNFMELRQKFSEMESIFGNFVLKKVAPNIIDTFAIGSRFFVIKFDNYHLIDSVVDFLKTIPDIEDPGYPYHLSNYSDVEYSNDIFSDFCVYPNPASDEIYVQILNNNYKGGYIEIYNSLGELLLSSKIHPMTLSHRINVAPLSSGIYFATIKSGTEIITKQFVILR